MQAALGHLRAAKQSLESAEPDKGGHRTKAIEVVNGAIRIHELTGQVESGSSGQKSAFIGVHRRLRIFLRPFALGRHIGFSRR
jgi:hypothetical protein